MKKMRRCFLWFPMHLFCCFLISVSFKNAHAQSAWKEDALRYIHTLAKKDGGYGWEGQPDSHLTPTFAVIGILRNLDKLPDDKDPLIQFVRTHHPQFGVNREAGPSGAEVRSLVYQQIQSIRWLKGNTDAFKDKVRGWKSQAGLLANYEKHGYPVLLQEMMTPVCRQLLGIPLADSARLRAYLRSRRRGNGSFNNAPTSKGGDGNILNTYWSLYAGLLAETDPLKHKTIAWLRSCQLENGGFTHQPDPVIGANDEVAYTWAGVKALQLLSSTPQNKAQCIEYLASLRNADGGFGNRPGLPSTPMATFYAVDALRVLGAFPFLDTARLAHHKPRQNMNFSELKIFTVQFQATGSGSPREAVMLADSLGIHLWGAKNAGSKWLTAAQRIAREAGVPVTFFHAYEPYGKYVHVEGMGSFSHITDHISPAGKTAFTIPDSISWKRFSHDFIQPLGQAGGGLVLQISNNEPLARVLLDESVNRGGYVAISTIHFGQNFLFFLPYLYQYRYQLPLVALQDAHGSESWWWANELAGYRTLFLAEEPTCQGLMKALKNNWVVAVRRDAKSGHRTRMLGGAPGVRECILSREEEWKWWEKGKAGLSRPVAAITVVGPSDSYEVAIPDKGVNIRIRCLWDGNRHILKEPVVSLEQLRVDGKVVSTEYIQKSDKKGRIQDAWYVHEMPGIQEGEHRAEATFRHRKDKTTITVKKKFTYVHVP